MTFDIKISGGQIIDGRGSAPVRADVGINAERITAVGDLSRIDSGIVIDATGRFVCPGFIDVHTHSDTYLLIEPASPSKIFQGVTTEVTGNCGASAAPISDISQLPSDWADKVYPGVWNSVAQYRELLDRARPAVNVVMLVGHNTLRRNVVGYDNRPATPRELQCMLQLLEQSMDEGAGGFSSGLIYAPGMYAPADEIVELARVAARFDGIYTSHMRSEGDRLLEAITETIGIGEQTGVRVEISHLKTAGADNWSKLDRAFATIRTARDRGLCVAVDRYPYISGATDLDVVLPAWASAGGRDAILARLADETLTSRMRSEMIASRPESDWAGITVGSTTAAANRKFRGMNLAHVAATLELHPVDAILHLCRSDRLMTGAFFAGMNWDNMLRILAEPYVMLGSDASLRSPTGPLSHDYPHPRAYGSFVRFLRMALDNKTVTLQEAVRKMTSLPAQHFNIARRGVLAEGMYADIAVFDPGTLRETTSYADPHRLAEGIDHVIVNGIPTLDHAVLSGQRAGRFLDA